MQPRECTEVSAKTHKASLAEEIRERGKEEKFLPNMQEDSEKHKSF
jgi:hypothetical protein